MLIFPCFVDMFLECVDGVNTDGVIRVAYLWVLVYRVKLKELGLKLLVRH